MVQKVTREALLTTFGCNCILGVGKSGLGSGFARGDLEYTTKTKLVYKHKLQCMMPKILKQ